MIGKYKIGIIPHFVEKEIGLILNSGHLCGLCGSAFYF
jgi:hypothetical protein